MEQNSGLRVAFYILLPSFFAGSGIIPAAALEQVVNDVKSDLEAVLGFPISEIELTHVSTTATATPVPTNATTDINVTTSAQTTSPAATVTTTEKSNDDWKWIVIGVVVGAVVIAIIIVVVYLV